MKYKCLIVDDEPLARQIIRDFIHEIPTLELSKECRNAVEALSYLHSTIVDIIFLDIQMPNLNGIEFLKSIEIKPEVIITSAFSDYAIEGYEYAVTDYLLKPIAFNRFLKAVNRAVSNINIQSNKFPVKTKQKNDDFIIVKVDKVQQKINLRDILFIEAYGNFIKIHTTAKTYITSETMKQVENYLPENNFIRVHRSFIVSIKQVDKIDGNQLVIGKNYVPVGKLYKLNVETTMSNHRI